MAEKTKLKKKEFAISDGAKITFQEVLPDFTFEDGFLTISLRYKIEESKFQINLTSDPVDIKIGDCGVFELSDCKITDAIEFAPGDFTLRAYSGPKVLMSGSAGDLNTNGDKGRQGNRVVQEVPKT